MSAIVVITTVGTEEQANTLARELVARRHAACVNIVPGLKSFYRWQGKLSHDTELMLVIKTLDREFDAVKATIQELHSYELPEIVCFTMSGGEERFLAWIAECVDKSAAAVEDDEDEEEEEDEEPAFADQD
jgi:periplasmic divalent cation tolerance protein